MTTAIEMQNVSKWFGDFKALDDVSLTTSQGEKVVICGPSGSGKSTLVRCINRLEIHQEGTIKVRGIELNDSDSSISEIRSEVGMVFQQFNLFPHLTVLQNLTLGPTKALGLSQKDANERAFKLLERVRIPEQANKKPGHLSGGQQQRVFLARALAQESDLYLMDEPFAGVDAATEVAIVELLGQIRDKGKTLIVVHHDLATAREYFDMILLLNMRVVGFGKTEDVFNAELLQKTYGGRLTALSEIADKLAREDI